MKRRLAYLALALMLGAGLLGGCSRRAQQLYKRAETFFAQGKYVLAAADYGSLLRSAPNDPLADNALYKLAYLYREEFDDPRTAVSLYQRLVKRYPDSPYREDALVWLVYLQARQLRDPAAVRATCRQIDEYCPEQPRLRASARLELARAYLAAGETQQAVATLKEIVARFGEEQDSVAEASYRLALVTRDELGQAPAAMEMLEEVITKYPNTAAASKAREALGWQYYAQKSLEDKQRQERLQRLARNLGNVPSWPAHEAPSLELLGALQALLTQAGARVEMEDLLTVTGLAFQMAIDWNNPYKTLYFHRNPFPPTAEAWGFGYNSWTFASAQEALPALVESLSRNRPVLLLFGSGTPRWRLLTGYRPSQQQVLLLAGGQRRPQPLTPAQFASGWPQRPGRQVFEPMPAEGIQFALTDRGPAPSRAERLRAAVLRAALALDQPQLLGAPAGGAAYETLTTRLGTCARGETEEAAKTGRWAAQAIPLLIRARQAAAASLHSAAPDFPAPERARVEEAAERYAEYQQRWQQLLTSIQTAAASTNAQVWTPLVSQAEALAAEEQATLRNLATALRG